MAKEAKKEKDMADNFTSLSFRSKQSGGPDNELISLSQSFAKQETRIFGNKALPTFKIRECIERTLRILTGTATEADIEYFKRRLKPEDVDKLRNNSGQLAGQG